MTKRASFLPIPAILVFIGSASAQAAAVHSGEAFSYSGVSTVTSGSGVGSQSNFSGTFSLASPVSGTDWSLASLTLDSNGFAWVANFSSVNFDGSNDTLSGTALFTIPETQIKATFLDGNNSTDLYTFTDVANPSNDNAGTLSYSASPVPEPSYVLLVCFSLGISAALGRRRGSRKQTHDTSADYLGTARN
ncbi:MAG TPA: hypothetical protein VKX25_05785 [Bryobacteraceae bacterium]|nr:hypothetical protein [Bryobacteraceae bacterium]